MIGNNILKDPKVSGVLNTLHHEAELDRLKRAYQKQNKIVDTQFLQTAYLSITPEQGTLLYCLATISGAKNIVEYGCSFGISSIYLAAAAKRHGGHLVTTDIEASKVAGTKQNLEAAELGSYVTVLQGNALETLTTLKTPLDFIFLDGANELYLPLFELLYPRFNDQVIIVVDNADKGGAAPYVDHIQKMSNEFTSISYFKDRLLISYRD